MYICNDIFLAFMILFCSVGYRKWGSSLSSVFKFILHWVCVWLYEGSCENWISANENLFLLLSLRQKKIICFLCTGLLIYIIYVHFIFRLTDNLSSLRRSIIGWCQAAWLYRNWEQELTGQHYKAAASLQAGCEQVLVYHDGNWYRRFCWKRWRFSDLENEVTLVTNTGANTVINCNKQEVIKAVW